MSNLYVTQIFCIMKVKQLIIGYHFYQNFESNGLINWLFDKSAQH